MKTSEGGRKLIESFEGLRLKAYRDSVGIWTIGYGHTSAAGRPLVSQGLVISAAVADAILTADLRIFEAGILAAVKKPMTQGEFDAFVSLAFNIGLGAFKTSSVLRAFNRGDVQAAADAFRLWTRAGGRMLPGLARRRDAERQMFLSGTPQPSEAALPIEAHRLDHPHGLIQRASAFIEMKLAGLWA